MSRVKVEVDLVSFFCNLVLLNTFKKSEQVSLNSLGLKKGLSLYWKNKDTYSIFCTVPGIYKIDLQCPQICCVLFQNILWISKVMKTTRTAAVETVMPLSHWFCLTLFIDFEDLKHDLRISLSLRKTPDAIRWYKSPLKCSNQIWQNIRDCLSVVGQFTGLLIICE